MRKAVKIEKTHSSGHPPPTAIIHQPAAESSGSEDSDSSSNASHVGPPRMTLSERYNLNEKKKISIQFIMFVNRLNVSRNTL